jgi:hypothetical protein
MMLVPIEDSRKVVFLHGADSPLAVRLRVKWEHSLKDGVVRRTRPAGE